MRSLITTKYQTTIPKEVRESLKLSVHDAVEWKITGGVAVVSHAKPAFMSHLGSIKTGKGDIAADIEQARIAMAERYR